MKLLIFTLLVSMTFFTGAGIARADGDDVFKACEPKKYGLESCPSDIDDFMTRLHECAYWGGEEPYDDERRDHIHKAVKELGCEVLDCEYTDLMQKYNSQEKSVKMIQDFVEEIIGNADTFGVSCVTKN